LSFITARSFAVAPESFTRRNNDVRKTVVNMFSLRLFFYLRRKKTY